VARPEVTEAALLTALRDGDAKAVVALFDGSPDKERARLRPAVEAVERTINWSKDLPGRGIAVAAAVLATATVRQVAERQWLWRWHRPAGVPEDVVVAVLGARTARFKVALAKAVLGQEWPAWGFLRPLVRAGVLDPSVDDDAYVRAMSTGLFGRGDDSPYEDLLADPELLEREVWRLFEVPDALGPSTERWRPALLKLAAEGRLDRERLLDACLAGLGTDFRPGQLGWLASFWTGLDPTDDELRERAGALLGLVASPEPAVVKLALPTARRLADLGAADPETLGELLRHPLGGSRKNLAVAALSLLNHLLRSAGDGDGERATRERLLGVAVGGLGHERADVAKRALDLVRRHTASGVPESVRLELLGAVDVAPPTLRVSVAELAGVPAAATVDTGDRLTPADARAPVQPGPWAAVADDRRLVAVEELDELVALFAVALEGEGTADDAERALGAVVRLGRDRPPGFADLVSPVRKRAAQLLEGWGASGARVEVARVVLAWAEGRAVRPGSGAAAVAEASGLRGLLGGLLPKRTAGKVPKLRPPEDRPAAFLTGRVDEIVAALVAGGPAVALSEPTHLGGRLDPAVLAERRSGLRRDGIGPCDRRQAVLRVAAGHEWPPPLRLDVADDVARRAGDPSDVRFVRDTPPDAAPDDPLVAAAERYLALSGRARFDASIFRPFWDVVSDGLGTRLAVSTFAGRPDVPAAMACIGLAERAQQSVVHWVDPVPMLEALFDGAVPLDGAAVALLVLALTGATEHRAAGVDAAVAAVGDGRFDPGALARATATLHRADVVVLTRLTRPVADLAATGPLHRLRAQQYLLALVEALGGHGHGLHGPLEALAQLSAGGIVVPEPARRVLTSLATRPSKAGQAAATVVANAVA
jgi:hypothetical protein